MTTPVPADVFEQPLRVSGADLDELQHVNNVVYLRWVQEIASAHWRSLVPPEIHAAIAWVARRHEIDYLNPAVLDDELLLRTWVGVAQGMEFERFTEIRRAADSSLLARARSLWCPVDPLTGRLRRVSPEVRAKVSVQSLAPSP